MKKLIISFIIVAFALGLCSCKKEQDPRFAEGSIVVTAENLPKISVTETNLKIACNIVSAVIGCDAATAENHLIVCKTEQECYEKLANGECDMVIAHEPSEQSLETLSQNDVSVQSQVIAKDAVVFMVCAKNPVSDLSQEQIKNVYSGSVSNWSELSGNEGEPKVFMQHKNSAATTAFYKHIKADTSVLSVPTNTIVTEQGTFSALLDYDNGEFSIGYALYYDVITPSADKNGTHKLLSVDGVYPDGSTIQNGTYPLSADITVTVNSQSSSDSVVRLLYDWILSEQGTRVIAGSGVILGAR